MWWCCTLTARPSLRGRIRRRVLAGIRPHLRLLHCGAAVRRMETRIALLCAAAAAIVVVASGQTTPPLGPGAGPWRVSEPEAEGLDAEALRVADDIVHAFVGRRDAFVVIKNDVIVHETYRYGRQPATATEQASATKSLCASLFGQWTAPAPNKSSPVVARGWLAIC
eukprot:COSAG01_NODE_10722_length_2095_cov_1.356212_1_plen_167_part_00